MRSTCTGCVSTHDFGSGCLTRRPRFLNTLCVSCGNEQNHSPVNQQRHSVAVRASKGVSHHQLCLAETQAGRGVRSITVAEGPLTGGCGQGSLHVASLETGRPTWLGAHLAFSACGCLEVGAKTGSCPLWTMSWPLGAEGCRAVVGFPKLATTACGPNSTSGHNCLLPELA